MEIDMQENKRGFFSNIKGMFVGIIKPEEYIKNGNNGSWGSAIMIALIFAILTPFLTVFLPYNNAFGNGKLAREVGSRIVDFRIDNDGFRCEERYEWIDESELNYICIDTSKNFVDRDEVDEMIDVKRYSNIVIASSREIVMYSRSEGIQTLEWDDVYDYLHAVYNQSYFDKQIIVDIIEKYDTPVIIWIYVFCAVASFIGFLICCAIWGGIGKIFSSAFGAKISYGTIFKAAVYIRAIWYIVKKLLNTYVVSGMGTLMWTIAFVIILLYLAIGIYKFAVNHPADNNTGGGMYAPAGNIPNDMYSNNNNMYNGNGANYNTDSNMYSTNQQSVDMNSQAGGYHDYNQHNN
ncbi:MAG: DUF1189 family protein [Coprococcus sp.]